MPGQLRSFDGPEESLDPSFPSATVPRRKQGDSPPRRRFSRILPPPVAYPAPEKEGNGGIGAWSSILVYSYRFAE